MYCMYYTLHALNTIKLHFAGSQGEEEKREIATMEGSDCDFLKQCPVMDCTGTVPVSRTGSKGTQEEKEPRHLSPIT